MGGRFSTIFVENRHDWVFGWRIGCFRILLDSTFLYSESMVQGKSLVLGGSASCRQFATFALAFIKTGVDAKEWNNELSVSTWNFRHSEK